MKAIRHLLDEHPIAVFLTLMGFILLIATVMALTIDPTGTDCTR